MNEAEIIRLEGLSKHFGRIKALDRVSFTIAKGEVHAVVGGNGAGKSSLMNLLAGVDVADEGRIVYRGLEQRFDGPVDARRHGISIMFQEPQLFLHRSVTENLFAHRELTRGGWLDHPSMESATRVALGTVGLSVSPRTRVADLSLGERQRVEIARALQGRSDVVIFDEPNSALTDVESRRLFEIIGRLRDQGITCVYVSQRLEDVFAIADRITVLRDGRYQGTFVTAETTMAAVVAAMIGKAAGETFPERPLPAGDAPIAVAVRGLCHSPDLGPIDLDVRAGEIVGLVGLEGSGHRTLLEVLFGLCPSTGGTIEYHGQTRTIRSPRDAIAAGVAFVPRSRRDEGLLLDFSIGRNVALQVLHRMRGRFGGIDRQRADRAARDLIEELGVIARGPDEIVGRLSGGNQQKVLIGKWLATRPSVLLLDDPTRGVDIGAKREIYRLCDRLARQGMSIVLASSELDELLGLSDRIVLFANGRITREIARQGASKVELMQAMGGAA